MNLPPRTTPMADELRGARMAEWRKLRDAAAVALYAQAVEPLAIAPDKLGPFCRDAEARARALADHLYPRS